MAFCHFLCACQNEMHCPVARLVGELSRRGWSLSVRQVLEMICRRATPHCCKVAAKSRLNRLEDENIPSPSNCIHSTDIFYFIKGTTYKNGMTVREERRPNQLPSIMQAKKWSPPFSSIQITG